MCVHESSVCGIFPSKNKMVAKIYTTGQFYREYESSVYYKTTKRTKLLKPWRFILDWQTGVILRLMLCKYSVQTNVEVHMWDWTDFNTMYSVFTCHFVLVYLSEHFDSSPTRFPKPLKAYVFVSVYDSLIFHRVSSSSINICNIFLCSYGTLYSFESQIVFSF